MACVLQCALCCPFQDRFIHDYNNFLYRDEEFAVDDLTAQQVMDIISQLDVTAGGMDGFLPEEMKLISFKAAGILANILNLVERGADWPTDLLNARAAFLAKDCNKLDVAFRSLVRKIVGHPSGWDYSHPFHELLHECHLVSITNRESTW